MKRSIFVVLSCFLLLGNIMLSSCGGKEKTPTQNPSDDQSQAVQKPNTDVQGGQTSNPDQTQKPDDKDEPSDSEQPNKPSDPKPANDFSKANAFLKKLDGNNFSYNSGNVHVQRQGDLISYAEPSDVDYYERSNGQTYIYTYENSDQMWYKKVLDGQDIFPIVDDLVASFQSAQWSTQSNNIYTGDSTLGQLKLTLKDEFTGIFNALGQNVEMFDVGRTVVSLPAQEQIMDETVAKPDAKKLYEVVNGQKQWNFPLLKETLQTWMIENDYLTQLSLGIQCDLQDIVYLNVDKKNKIEFLILAGVNGKKLFQNYNVNDDLTSSITNGRITSSQEFKTSLSDEMKKSFGIGKGPIEPVGMAQNFEYSTLDDDYGTHQAEFEKMTQNIFNRLETIGYQGGSINNPGTIVTDYMDAKVLFGMKELDGGVTAGSDMGYRQLWRNYYIVENHGKISLLKVEIEADANSSKKPLEFVLENTNPRKWKVSSVKETLLQDENLNLYEKSFSIKNAG